MILAISLCIASPPGYGLDDATVGQAKAFAAKSGARISTVSDCRAAVKGAAVVYTDVWISMGQESEAEARRRAFASYQVDAGLLSLAAEDAILMHPLPAHHGEEVAEGLLGHPRSVVFDQAENRLHIQKAILLKVLGGQAD